MSPQAPSRLPAGTAFSWLTWPISLPSPRSSAQPMRTRCCLLESAGDIVTVPVRTKLGAPPSGAASAIRLRRSASSMARVSERPPSPGAPITGRSDTAGSGWAAATGGSSCTSLRMAGVAAAAIAGATVSLAPVGCSAALGAWPSVRPSAASSCQSTVISTRSPGSGCSLASPRSSKLPLLRPRVLAGMSASRSAVAIASARSPATGEGAPATGAT
jgi:hypothetical protein